MSRQRTIRESLSASGIGLHSANRVDMTLRPAPIDSGIIFRRSDQGKEFRAQAQLVRDTTLCTALVHGNSRVATIEHLMSALMGLGIDNIIIELSAPEVPIMDGSSAPFVYMLQRAGIREQDAAKRFIVIDKPIEVVEENKWAKLLPHEGFRLDFTIDFNHPVFRHRNNFYRLDFSTGDYIREISRARTFGFLRDIETLHNMGLALGGNLDNAVVVDDFRVMNEHGLRFDDEFVRHKLLDALGDMYLVGAPLLGWYQGYRSGHDLNNKLCLALLNNPGHWHYQIFEDNELINYNF